MARVGFEHLLVILVVAVLGVSCAAVQEDRQEFPSLLTSLGTKMALADDYYDDDDSGKDAAQTPASGCCFPLVWQGFSVHKLSSAPVGGRGHGRSGPRLSGSIDQFFVDGSHQRLAGNQKAFFGHHHSLNISWIFSIGAARTGDYYIFDKAAQKCVHRVVRNVAWHRQCIPANATSHGSFSLGPSVGGLKVQQWSFGGRSRSSPAIDGDRNPSPRPRVYYGASMLVVPTTCIPVLVQEHGFVFRGVDQQQEDDFSSRMNIDDTGSLSGEDLHYESYARYISLFSYMTSIGL